MVLDFLDPTAMPELEAVLISFGFGFLFFVALFCLGFLALVLLPAVFEVNRALSIRRDEF